MSNVSSVKNLNGEVFSAIQDASLTDIVNSYGESINDVSSTVKTYSGQWGGGTSVDTIPVAVVSPLVTGFSGESAYLGIESTALNLSSYVPVSSIGYNSNYISTISGKTISSYTGRYAMTANYANTADRAYRDRNSNEITSYYQPKLRIAGDAGTITAINGSAVGASIPEGWELVGGTGISIVDDAENNQTIISADSFDLTIGSGLAFENNTLYVSAQGSNPEGVMVESACEYNAVNEISAYNGSAIAQYGAEKQWLVHDDTLVHASNSAQYALGVNLSAVAQLLGVDETVLWSGSASKNDTMQLSEPFSGFHYLEIYGSIVQDNGTYNMLPACKVCVDDVVLPASFNIAGFGWWGDISRYKIGMNIGTYVSSYSSIQHAGGTFQGYWDSQWQAAENNNLKINRIIGIGRKQ